MAVTWRTPLFAAAILSMTWGIWLGLMRLGWALPLPWPDQLILHGPLMIAGFLGTLIGLERAIETGRPWVYAAPLCSASGAVALVFGPPGFEGALLITVASAIVALDSVLIIRRQRALCAVTMAVGAVAWLLGNAWWTTGASIYRVVPLWIAFIVLTIAGERLELNRGLQPAGRASIGFVLSALLFTAGVARTVGAHAVDTFAMGAGLVMLALWLAWHDVARRAVRQAGLARFMAVCLFAGYAWLIVAGVLLVAIPASMNGPIYDAALHAIFLGFVVSMLFAHAPIVLPRVAGVPLPYRPAFYAPLAVLHGSVVVRLTGDLIEALGRLRSWGGLLNAVAILFFAGHTAYAVVAARAGLGAVEGGPSTRARDDLSEVEGRHSG